MTGWCQELDSREKKFAEDFLAANGRLSLLGEQHGSADKLQKIFSRPQVRLAIIRKLLAHDHRWELSAKLAKKTLMDVMMDGDVPVSQRVAAAKVTLEMTGKYSLANMADPVERHRTKDEIVKDILGLEKNREQPEREELRDLF